MKGKLKTHDWIHFFLSKFKITLCKSIGYMTLFKISNRKDIKYSNFWEYWNVIFDQSEKHTIFYKIVLLIIWLFDEKLFLFSQCSLHGMTLEFRFLLYTKLSVFTFQWTNGNCLVSVVWKMTTCWFFGSLFLHTNHGCCPRHSADAYMANRE